MSEDSGARDGWAVDIVLCVDVTASMSAVLRTVLDGALSFHQRLETVMAKRNMPVGRMRLRVIAFRDFGADTKVIERTGFLELPGGAAEFETFIAGLRASGGGDAPESGLEALALAVQSDWSPPREDDSARHIIVMFTDAPAHPLGKHTPGWEKVRFTGRASGFFRRRREDVPAAAAPGTRQRLAGYEGDVYPRDLDELHDQWGRPDHDGALMDQSAKRLLVFAPEREPWRDIAESWDKTLFVPSVAGTGLEEIALDEVISTIARSL